MDLSSILPLMMGGNGNNQMANMLGAMMGGGANNFGATNSSNGNGLDMAGLINMMSGMNGGADNAQGNSMAAMLPMLMSMMNGNNNSTHVNDASSQDTYSDNVVTKETDINYSMYKHMQEQARRGL